MKKQPSISKIFEKSIKSILTSKYIPREQQLFYSQKSMTNGKIIRNIGQGCFNSAPTNVWGKTKNGLEEKMLLLNDKQIDSSCDLLVLGFGDADNNSWYGAGPTRDMRRAYYTPMLLVLQPNIKLGKKGFFSTKSSEYIHEFANSLDSLNLSNPRSSTYSQNNNSTTLIDGIISVSAKENADFHVFAVNARKSNNNYSCDLGALLNFGSFSGHEFLQPEARKGSPLYGPLSLAMGSKENLMQGPVKALYEWLGNCFIKFKNVTNSLPIQPSKIFPMVYVYNS